MNSKIISLLLLLLTASCPTYAADLPGSKDPADLKRYEGSQIIRYEEIKFDRFIVPLGKMTKFDFGSKAAEFEKSETLEGAVTRATYHVSDPLRSSLEVFRNYETAFVESGWTILWKASGKSEFGNSYAHLYESLKDNDQLFTYNEQNAHALVARKESNGLTALLFVTKFEMGLTRGIKIAKGDPIIQLDVIQTKKMDEKMVIPTSSEMEKAINETGRVSLYGIYFDFNSAAVKQESEETIKQIAKLLREQPKLKLLVVGHTDNAGGFDYNKDLSASRAAAVIENLTRNHGIESLRLKAFGASYAAPIASNHTDDGRAKNRRVELVELTKN